MSGPSTHVVDPYQGGHFTTVGDAVKAAKEGDRILVRPGQYEESLVVDKPLEIIGDGPQANVELWGTHENVLSFKAPYGRVANLTLRQRNGRVPHCVSISYGRLDLEACDIQSYAGSCVFIFRGADPLLRGNVIHDATGNGIFIYEGGRGTIEDNQIIGCKLACVHVQEGSTPVFRRNAIRDGQEAGVYVNATGQGWFEGNTITGNGHSGVVIASYGSPTIRGNQITGNAEWGVKVGEYGTGLIEDNNLAGNRKGAWHIDKMAASNLVRSRNAE
jgi:parallel beta-helix repeat protein